MEGENRALAGSRDPLASAILLHTPTLYSTWGQQSNPKGSPASAGSPHGDGVRQRGSTRAAKVVPPAPIMLLGTQCQEGRRWDASLLLVPSMCSVLLTNSPVFLPISSAPSLPAGALAAPGSPAFPTQAFWGLAEAGPSRSQSHSPPRPAGLEVRLWLGDRRAGLEKGCGVGADPATALGWGGQTLPSCTVTSSGFALGREHPRA